MNRFLHSGINSARGVLARGGSPRTVLSSANAMRKTIASLHSSTTNLKIIPFLLADIGEGMTECQLIQWFVKPGDRVEQFTPICEIQSDKATAEISSRYDGVITKLHHAPDSVVTVGSPLVDINVTDHVTDDAAAITPPMTANAPIVPVTQNSQPEITQKSQPEITQKSQLEISPASLQNAPEIMATPAVRRIAKEHSIDLSKVTPTGPNGRILKMDVLAFLQNAATAQTTDVDQSQKDKAVPLTQIQKSMFKAMTKSLAIPHFGYSEEIILNNAIEFRASINNNLLDSNLKKVSFMPIFLKALSLALLQFPILNSCVVMNGDSPHLQFRSSHNLGIAMDTKQGLLVPNVKNVQEKSILEIAQELERLRQLAAKGTLSVKDLSGGTFTLSNIGNIGGTYLHPVLVATEVCIGAIGRSQRVPRFETITTESGQKQEKVVAKEVINVSFNADHRVIDGATVARFTQVFKHYIESPALMAFEMK